MADLSTEFTGIKFPNPFLLASAPPTESESNIRRAYDAGWGGVVTKTIGLHQVHNVRGPKTKFLRLAGRRHAQVDDQARRLDGDGLVELGAHQRQAHRLVDRQALGHQARLPRPRAGGLDHGRLRLRRGDAQLADAGAGACRTRASMPSS